MSSPVRSPILHLHVDDNVCVSVRPLDQRTTIELNEQRITIIEPIKAGHKIAIRTIERDEPVRKYGQIIGFATERIGAGEWVHSHNLVQREFARDHAVCSEIPPPPAPLEGRTFQGYRRADGKAGTRNYVAVISNVNCSASVARHIAEKFSRESLKDYPNIDGVVAFRHGGGCGLQWQGLQHEMLNRTLAGVAKHPNIGAYLLVGLGCEQGALGYLMESQGLVQISGTKPAASRLPPVLSMQDLGGTTKTIEAGVKLIGELLPRANDVRRIAIPAAEIILGTNCGGSDGNSGITANPALGVASDLLIAAGGTSALAETTEAYGAEHLLTRRAVSPAVAQKLLDHLQWWVWYSGVFGCECDNNPSVGNKEGGLSTIAEKSLGAIAKGGSTALVDVYRYADPISAKGLVFMDTPGFDPMSVTGLVAGGCNMIAFTTGRGSCFGCKPVPSLKIATNTPMYERMIDDMDLNAGEILTGEKTVAQVGREIFEEILAVASGKKTKSEIHGYGDEEFVPWMVGPTL